jgi:hypothetical protein
MPLFDHFRPPVSKVQGWSTIHAAWAGKIVDRLNDRLIPMGFLAGERVASINHAEIDIGTWESATRPRRKSAPNGRTATLDAPPAAYTAPEPDATAELRADFSLTTAIRIHDEAGTLVAVIELVSPSNKDRPLERDAFAGKVVAHVMDGVCVAVVDVVTIRRTNLHNGVCDVMHLPEHVRMPDRPATYAVTYRPKTTFTNVATNRTLSVDVWKRPLVVGEPMPTMPLRLTGDTFVPLELEATYLETCRRRGII